MMFTTSCFTAHHISYKLISPIRAPVGTPVDLVKKLTFVSDVSSYLQPILLLLTKPTDAS